MHRQKPSAAMKNVCWILFFVTLISSLVDVSEAECSMTSPCPLKG